jgi:hypothetical protein
MHDDGCSGFVGTNLPRVKVQRLFGLPLSEGGVTSKAEANCLRVCGSEIYGYRDAFLAAKRCRTRQWEGLPEGWKNRRRGLCRHKATSLADTATGIPPQHANGAHRISFRRFRR